MFFEICTHSETWICLLYGSKYANNAYNVAFNAYNIAFFVKYLPKWIIAVSFNDLFITRLYVSVDRFVCYFHPRFIKHYDSIISKPGQEINDSCRFSSGYSFPIREKLFANISTTSSNGIPDKSSSPLEHYIRMSKHFQSQSLSLLAEKLTARWNWISKCRLHVDKLII